MSVVVLALYEYILSIHLVENMLPVTEIIYFTFLVLFLLNVIHMGGSSYSMLGEPRTVGFCRAKCRSCKLMKKIKSTYTRKEI